MTQQTFFSLTEARKQIGDKKIETLIQKAQTIVKEFKSKELELIEVLQELDQTKAYRISGFNSLYTFCTEFLNLSEHQAYHYITVSRKCQEVPLLKSALFEKKITISKARRLCAVIGKNTAEQNLQWIETAQKSTHKELERVIRKKDPRALVPDTTRYLTDTHLKLQATVSHETYNKLQRVKEILISKGETDYDRIFSQMAEEFLQKHDPVEKAKRWQKKNQNEEKSIKTSKPTITKSKPIKPTLEKQKALPKTALVQSENPIQKSTTKELGIFRVENKSMDHKQIKPENTLTSQPAASTHSKSARATIVRSVIPAKIQHQVHLRDQGQCQYEHKGKKCQSRYFIELHHRTPVALGGKHTVDNLLTLCSGHHKRVHNS